MNKLVLSLVTFLCFQLALSQDLKLIKTLDKEYESFSTDRLGNIYLINPYSITMYNNQGDSLREFNSRKYGSITFFDATDPYKILVFFKDYNRVVFLDNYLSENGSPLDFQDLGYDQISFACQSREKGIWLFDPTRQRLLKLSAAFEVQQESINIGQWLGKSIQASFMVEQNNRLYIKDENETVYIFDHFGTYMKKVKLESSNNIQVLEGMINYIANNQFCQYQLKYLETYCKELPLQGSKIGRIEKERLFLGDGAKLSIFKTN